MRSFVLDTAALDALGSGNTVLSKLLYGTPRDVDDVVLALYRGPRLLVPAMALLHAGRQRTGLTRHVSVLEPLHVVLLDAPAVTALCESLADLAPDIGHVVHTAATYDASVITPSPESYPESVRVVRLPI
ncbi:hypothetical protein [Amycolatopsis sp. TNS106]|uniref:hypothetical protein n=1 Tax=Amycolatopsis sp. TNS106 TaxID=2861750 RepID=UPI001C565380|nr:hypothetical protein [Amycolatopsis sp. TNS106]QXV63513.1 hypothetical protein CVV72_40855 [Amycolatopsis sp. TNS106]